MEDYRQAVILGSVAFYMILCIGVGLWAMRRTHSAGDFFVAGRGLGPLVVSLAVFSSTLSGFGFVGGPGLVYAGGLSSLWMAVVSALGFGLGFYLISKRIRMIAEVRGTFSLPDVIAARFGGRAARGLTALTILLGVLGYMATQILAMATVLNIILSETETLAWVGITGSVVISTAVLLFYSVTGGIIASVYTDLVQGLIMSFAGVLVVITAAGIFDSGFSGVSHTLLVTDAEAIMPFGTLGAFASLGWAFLFGLGLAGQPHVVTKMMMNRNLGDNRLTLPMTIVGYAFAAMLWISIGMVMRALVIGDVALPLAFADEAAPRFLQDYAHPLLAGVVFAGLFAAIMSTADSFLNIGAAAITHDLPRALKGRSLDRELYWARVTTVVLCVFSAAFALFSHYVNDTLIGILGAFGWGTFAAALAPVLIFGLNWKGASPRAAVFSILFSLVFNLVFQVFQIKLPYAMSPGFIVLLASMILFIVISLADGRRPLPRDIDRILEL